MMQVLQGLQLAEENLHEVNNKNGNHCDQIGLFLKVLSHKFSYYSRTKIFVNLFGNLDTRFLNPKQLAKQFLLNARFCQMKSDI